MVAVAELECVHYLLIVGLLPWIAKLLGVCNQSHSLPHMAELLSVYDRLWLHCTGWPSCFACTIDCAFIAAVGQGLVA